MNALDLTVAWPVPAVSAAVLHGPSVISTVGDTERVQRLASLTKPMAAWAIMVGVEEGIVALDDEVGQPGCTLRHLLAHAGGFPFEGSDPIAAPATNRIYSNSGFDLAAAHLADAAAMSFADYLDAAVLAPLGMSSSVLHGSAAHGVRSTLADTTRFVAEVMRPTLLHDATADDVRSVQYPALGGMVPGVGRFDRSPWGLGFEVRGDKSPHWTGTTNSPRTFGHFGGAGTMMWIDPDHDVGLVALADRPFDEWRDEAMRAWSELSDAVLAEHARGAAGS